jgi:hypothetical protein
VSRATAPSGIAALLKENSLGLFFALIFLLSLVAQAFVGTAFFNREQLSGGLEPVGVGDYVLSSAYWVDITENWQSEFLQFLLFITATVWFVQKGSPESKEIEKAGRESDKDQKVGRYVLDESPAWARAGGRRLSVFSHSLALVMGALFVGSWLAQSLGGAVAYSEEQLRNHQDAVTWTEYLALPDFWSRTIQNWQSEFLAVLAMVVLSIYLRERGSPESKPVGSAHRSTGIQG